MTVRKATPNDYIKLTYHLRKKHIDYITVEHMQIDLLNKNLYVLEDDSKLLAMISIVWQEEYECYGLKRLLIFNKKNCGKGYAKTLLAAVLEDDKKYSVTPWVDNVAMHRLLSSLGFEYVRTFNEIWTLWER